MDRLAEDGIGADGRLRLRGIEANRLGAYEIQIFEQPVHGVHAAPKQKDDGGFVYSEDGDEAAIGLGDDLDKVPALGLLLQDGEECGSIDDNQSKTP